MKFKNLIAILSKEDILNLINLQDKVNIKLLDIDENIKLTGIYKVMGMNFEFYTQLSLINFYNNTLYISIDDFKLGNKNNSNILEKKAIGFIISSINNIEGITVDKKNLRIELDKILKNYSTEEYGMEISELQLNNVILKKDIIELHFNYINIKILKFK